eukprot:TRINITY_DN3392_c0_g2_i1.p1 TRINITY_DN3392_c0_g2~~TRINITY_DN3392_c0_g2_i1.p1  ORF type:complete len:499 (-),score=93.19 TRINITY_DN3392_c0_g2_i1:77-1573(-)
MMSGKRPSGTAKRRTLLAVVMVATVVTMFYALRTTSPVAGPPHSEGGGKGKAEEAGDERERKRHDSRKGTGSSRHNDNDNDNDSDNGVDGDYSNDHFNWESHPYVPDPLYPDPVNKSLFRYLTWIRERSAASDHYCGQVSEARDGVWAGKYARATERFPVSGDPWLETISGMLEPHYKSEACTVPRCACADRFAGIECNILLPDRTEEPVFMMLGVQKGGTSSFTTQINSHPYVIHLAKDHYFDITHFNDNKLLALDHVTPEERDDATLCYEIGNYFLKYFSRQNFGHKQFPVGAIFGAGDAGYLTRWVTVQRVAYFHPNAKLIAIIRDPVIRAWSHFNMKLTQGKKLDFTHLVDVGLDHFKKALAPCQHDYEHLEHCQSFVESFKSSHDDTMTKGFYVLWLTWWERFFPVDNILVMQTEQMHTHPQAFYNVVSDYIGVPHYEYPHMLVRNADHEETIPEVEKQRLVDFYRPINEELFAHLKRKHYKHAHIDPDLWYL